MSHPNDWKDDELQDRLMDQALRELLGGETPPDLSAKILAAVEKPTPVSLQQKEQVMDRSKRSYIRWALAGTAACLLVAVAIGLTLPALQWPRIVARGSS